MRLRYFEQSTTSDSPTACPACEVPPPRASTLHALFARNAYRPFGFFYVRGATMPTGMIW